MRIVAASIAACLMLGQPASADRAEEAFVAGDFLEAAQIAEAEGGAANYARAARCLLADIVVSGALNEGRLKTAETLARQSLDLDPQHPEARLQLAIALSLLSRDMSVREALDSGNASTARDLVESVIEDEPGNVYAHGFLAVWHVEVVRRGGSLGSAFMKASMADAFAHYRAAIATGESDASLHWQFARALAAHDAQKYAAEISILLERAATDRSPTALSDRMQARAAAFGDYIESHTRRDVERYARSLL
ncbi:MAG: hypothetical protein WA989_12265 [Henriciella sp.]|uniref:hypothetical protein n=1 Tax=Henriciella sp. TaxID=1968823 RepID=UPI003C730876